MSFKLQRPLVDAVLETVGRIDIVGSRVASMTWDEASANVLSTLMIMDVVKEEDVVPILHKRLLEVGRESFNEHRDRGTAPDHTYSPEALAYAMREDGFTEKELSQIAFAHEKNAFEFVEHQLKGKDFPKIVLSQLLERRDRPMSMRKGDPAVCVEH